MWISCLYVDCSTIVPDSLIIILYSLSKKLHKFTHYKQHQNNSYYENYKTNHIKSGQFIHPFLFFKMARLSNTYSLLYCNTITFLLWKQLQKSIKWASPVCKASQISNNSSDLFITNITIPSFACTTWSCLSTSKILIIIRCSFRILVCLFLNGCFRKVCCY